MLLFRLALRMGRTVGELEATLGADEFAEWLAFDLIEPVGDERGDVLAGHVCATLANVHRDPDRTPAFAPSDFTLRWGEKLLVTEEENRARVAANIRAQMESLRAAQERKK